MSYTNIDRFSDPRHLIPYLNGFLRTLEILNLDTDHGPTFYIEELLFDQSIENTIVRHLKDEKYTVTYTEVTDWKASIQADVKEFFEHILTNVELTEANKNYIQKYHPNETIRDLTNFTYIMDEFIALVSKLLTDTSTVYEVFVDNHDGSFYECYQRDYLFISGDDLYFIHLGVSD